MNQSLTVLMAVHNGLPYLSAALQSVAAQTFRNFEWLIIDDASTDGSTVLLQEWAARDPRIRLLVQGSNQGLTASLNLGLAEARSTWIARQDADDISHPLRLEKQMAALSRCPDLALLGTNGFLIDISGAAKGLINAPTGHAAILWSAVFYNPFIHSSVIFHREKIQALGGYDSSFRVAQDYDLWLRVMAAHPVGNLSERLLSYRLHSTSVTVTTAGPEREQVLESLTQNALLTAGLREFAIPTTLAMIAKLRGCLSPAEYATFWQLHRQMLPTFSEMHPSAYLREAVALLHWKIAGATSGLATLRGLLAVLFTSPSTFFRLIRDRLKGPSA